MTHVMVLGHGGKRLMFLSLLIASIALLSGCSTFKHVFSNTATEDYNALTYGKDYAGTARDAASGASRNLNGAWSNGPSADYENARSMANGANDKKDSYYKDKEKEIEELDPTDDHVRQQIETGRGLAVAAYHKGDRATRGDFLDGSPNDGSLWSNENDANYFFTKGKVRASGDIISVKMEEPMVRNLAEEIKKSLTPAEQEVEMALYMKNAAGAKDDADLKAYRNVASEDLKSTEAEDVKARMEKSVRWSQIDLATAIGVAPNEELRAEIIDRYPNGNYKVRAVKRVLYRGASKMVSLVGVAPAADFDEKDMIASGKLYEYKIKVAR